MLDRICRYCLSEEEKNNPLLAPCNCRGSIKYVHQNCLNIWRFSWKRGTNIDVCEQCKSRYKIRKFSILFETVCLSLTVIIYLAFLVILVLFNFIKDSQIFIIFKIFAILLLFYYIFIFGIITDANDNIGKFFLFNIYCSLFLLNVSALNNIYCVRTILYFLLYILVFLKTFNDLRNYIRNWGEFFVYMLSVRSIYYQNE